MTDTMRAWRARRRFWLLAANGRYHHVQFRRYPMVINKVSRKTWRLTRED